MTATRLFPILRSDDLAASIAFYERAFKAEVTYRFAPEGGEVVYVAMAVGGGTIGIGFEPEFVRGDSIALWIYTDDIDADFSAAVEAGAEALSEPADMPWGERVAELRDPFGNHIYLGLAAA